MPTFHTFGNWQNLVSNSVTRVEYTGTPVLFSSEEFSVKPSVTGSNPDDVEQGEAWTCTNGVVTSYPYLAYYLSDYTGSGTITTSNTTGVFTCTEPDVGTHTFKVRAMWPGGISDAVSRSVTVDSYTLNRDNMFGTLSQLATTISYSASEHTDYKPIVGALSDDGGTVTFDNGVIKSESGTCVAFWSENGSRLVAFYVDSGNTIDSIRILLSVSTEPVQGTTFGSNGNVFVSTASQETQATTTNIRGYHFPCGS